MEALQLTLEEQLRFYKMNRMKLPPELWELDSKLKDAAKVVTPKPAAPVAPRVTTTAASPRPHLRLVEPSPARTSAIVPGATFGVHARTWVSVMAVVRYRLPGRFVRELPPWANEAIKAYAEDITRVGQLRNKFLVMGRRGGLVKSAASVSGLAALVYASTTYPADVEGLLERALSPNDENYGGRLRAILTEGPLDTLIPDVLSAVLAFHIRAPRYPHNLNHYQVYARFDHGHQERFPWELLGPRPPCYRTF